MAERETYDAIVVGAGSMGSAAAFHLARRGRRVLALEQFGIVHERGSHHGLTRIIRLAYHEDPRYVPLLLRAYELWRELERLSGEPLLETVGSLDLGREDSAVVRGALAACRDHDLAHEVLDTRELERRFPAYRPAEPIVAVLQPDGGILASERCVRAHTAAAVAAGATIKTSERVVSWEPSGDHIGVRTDRATYAAERLVLCPGAWAGEVLRLEDRLFTVRRQVVAWLEPSQPDVFEPARFPVFIADWDGGVHYGFPVTGVPGVKLGRMNHPGEVVDPSESAPPPREAEVDPLRAFARAHFPAASGRTLDASTCLFTNTPDEHFVVDLHPDDDRVVIASACSGHGFKFASVVGEVLADLATTGTTTHPIEFLELGRFRSSA